MNTIDRQRKLVSLLYDRTTAGQLVWKETADEDSYTLNMGPNSIIVTKMEVRSGKDYYVLQLLNLAGSVVENFTTIELDLDLSGWTYTEKMEVVFERVRRTVLGADEVLDNLIESLERDPDIPF